MPNLSARFANPSARAERSDTKKERGNSQRRGGFGITPSSVMRRPHAVAITTVYPRFSTVSTPPNVSTISGIVCTGILVTK